MPQQFEIDVEATFETLRRQGIKLFHLYPPIRQVGKKGHMPVFTPTTDEHGPGVDFFGWTRSLNADTPGQVIAVELKETRNYAPSLRIRASAEAHGSGLQEHQLEALAAVHMDGHLAYLLWRNGGIIGRLSGSDIVDVYRKFAESEKVKTEGKTPASGSRTIAWARFARVEDVKDWLP